MVTACLTLVLLGAALGGPLTWWARRLGVRWGQMDRPGERKVHATATPATGGVAIFWTMTLPLAAILAAVWLLPESMWRTMIPAVVEHLPGGRAVTGMGAAMLGCMAALHVMGLIDDRRPLGPKVKLAVQLGVGAVMAGFFNVRLLELLGGPVSAAITVLWFAAIINAFNFLDNMDGLSGGVAAICAAILMAAALLGGQWFIAGVLGLLIGALIGFLWFNFPPASIFMGDGGSLVVGFVLAFCSVRLTYVSNEAWWAAATPLVVLAIPLYDLASVTVLRLRQGRSPFVGDTQHFSHRLVARGLSRRAAVGVIWACTAATGLGGVMLAHVSLWQAAVVVGQTAAVLLVLALLEMKTRGRGT